MARKRSTNYALCIKRQTTRKKNHHKEARKFLSSTALPFFIERAIPKLRGWRKRNSLYESLYSLCSGVWCFFSYKKASRQNIRRLKLIGTIRQHRKHREAKLSKTKQKNIA